MRFCMQDRPGWSQVGQRLRHCLADDTHIQSKAPVPYIEGVPLIAFEHPLETVGRTAKALDLGQSCDARFENIPEFITGNYLRELPAIFMHMWPGTYNTHVSN